MLPTASCAARYRRTADLFAWDRTYARRQSRLTRCHVLDTLFPATPTLFLSGPAAYSLPRCCKKTRSRVLRFPSIRQASSAAHLCSRASKNPRQWRPPVRGFQTTTPPSLVPRRLLSVSPSAHKPLRVPAVLE